MKKDLKIKNRLVIVLFALTALAVFCGIFFLNNGSKIEILDYNPEQGNIKFSIENVFVDMYGEDLVVIKNVEGVKARESSLNVKTISGFVVEAEQESSTFTTDVFAMESLPMQSATITLKKHGPVNSILRCEDFNFWTNKCSGWQITNIPFQDNETHIVFEVDSFSGYVGTNITILNVQSYPSVGGNWEVRFETSGVANLTITATRDINYTEDYTRWTDYSEDSEFYDLKFLE